LREKKVQEYKSTRVQEYKSSRVQEYKSSRVQEYKSTRVQKDKEEYRVHNRKLSEPGFSGINGFSGSWKGWSFIVISSH
jgi:hypothetical protein